MLPPRGDLTFEAAGDKWRKVERPGVALYSGAELSRADWTEQYSGPAVPTADPSPIQTGYRSDQRQTIGCHWAQAGGLNEDFGPIDPRAKASRLAKNLLARWDRDGAGKANRFLSGADPHLTIGPRREVIAVRIRKSHRAERPRDGQPQYLPFERGYRDAEI